MTVKPAVQFSEEQFRSWYGDPGDGSAPTPEQWRRLLQRRDAVPITLVNLFKLRDRAAYQPDMPEAREGLTGQDAFDRYAEVSMPTMKRVGGTFLLIAPHRGTFLGEEEDWDLVAIGAYPDTHACLSLYGDEAYRAAFRHRTAACARQKVFICEP